MSNWLVPLLIGLASVAIAATGANGQEFFRYQREAIANGQLWRLITAHVTHLGPGHLMLNVAGLVLVWLLVGERFRNCYWWLIALLCIAGINLGFWLLDVELRWYVGLSGLLHGLLIAGAVAGLRTERTESLIIIAAVVLKLLWEQIIGPLPGSESSSGGDVIVNAHLYGAVAGLFAAALLRHRVREIPAI